MEGPTLTTKQEAALLDAARAGTLTTRAELVLGIVERDCPEVFRALGYRRDPELAAALRAGRSA